MDRKWPGIIGGLVVFLIILYITIYLNSDFDHQLIQEVTDGVPAEKLLPKIDSETMNLKLYAKQQLESDLMNRKLWGNGDLISKDDYNYYDEIYQRKMKYISDYDTIRKQFVKREISKEDFLEKIKEIKDKYDMN